MQKRLFFVLFYFIYFTFLPNGVGQKEIIGNNRIDSLHSVLEIENGDSLKIEVLQNIADEYEGQNWQKAVEYATKAIVLADKNDFILKEAKTRIDRGLYLVNLSKLDSAEIDFSRALKLLNSISDSIGIADCYNNLGVIYSDRGDCTKALNNYNQAIKIWETIDNQEKVIRAINNTAICFSRQGEFPTADSILNIAVAKSKSLNYNDGLKLTYSNKIVSYGQRSIVDTALMYSDSLFLLLNSKKDKTSLGILYFNRGNIYLSVNNNEKSIKEYLIAEQIFKEIGNKGRLASVQYSLGLIFNHLGQFKKSKEYINKALNIYKALGLKNDVANSYYTLGFLISKIDSLNFAEQIKSYKIADSIYTITGNMLGHARILQILGVTYRKKGDFNQSVLYLTKANDLITTKGYTSLLFSNSISLGLCYSKLGQYEAALLNFNKAIELGSKVNRPVHEAYEYKSITLYKMGNYQNAYTSLKKAYALSDSLFEESKVKAINEIETKYQTRQRKDSIELLMSDKIIMGKDILVKKTQNQVLSLTALSFLAIIVFLFWINKTRKQRNQLLEQKNNQIATLHKENIHRVKNNLNLLLNMTKMQIRRIDTHETREAMQENEKRLAVLSLIEQKLQFDQKNLVINIDSYLQDIVLNLQYFYTTHEKNVNITLQAIQVELEANIAMQLGLIINELVTNSMKHGFEAQQNPAIDIVLKQNNIGFSLLYKDNGKGFDNAVDVQNSSTLGMQLIHSITKMLGGTLMAQVKNGAVFTFQFSKLL